MPAWRPSRATWPRRIPMTCFRSPAPCQRRATSTTSLAAGTQYVLYPDATPFKTEGVWAFSWPGATGWAQTAINGVTRYWVRVRISAFTSHTTTPRNQDQRAYALQHPHIVLPSSAVQGDAPPRVLLRT